jgi:hypothetical protein
VVVIVLRLTGRKVLLDQPDDFSGLGVTARLRFLVDRHLVDFDLETTRAGADEVKIDLGILLADFGRQPGGLGQVVSDPAVFDRDVHGRQRTTGLTSGTLGRL